MAVATAEDFDIPTDPEPVRGAGKADGLLVRFFHKPFRRLQEVSIELGGKTTIEKRHVWVKEEMVELRVPGDKLNSPVKFATPEIKERFAAAYAAWKSGQDQEVAGGWPLEKWPGADVAQVETLREARVRTVEQFAGMSDANLMKLGPGWRPLRQAAIDFLKAAESAAPMAALREENEKLKSQQEANQRMISDLGERLKKLESGKGKTA